MARANTRLNVVLCQFSQLEKIVPETKVAVYPYGRNGYSQETMNRMSRDFQLKKKLGTPRIREELLRAIVEGVPVVEVGDMVWWPFMGREEYLLAAVKLQNGAYAVIGYDDGAIVTPVPCKFSWVLNNLTAMPKLELDDDHISVWFAHERFIMAAYTYDMATHGSSWKYTGIGSSGRSACREFAKHGITFDASSGPADSDGQ